MSPWLLRVVWPSSLIICVFLLCNTTPGSSNLIKCFNCSSWENAECLYVKANDTESPFVHACDDDRIPLGAEPFCRTIVQTIRDGNGTKRLQRRCGWIKYYNKYNQTPPCYDVSQKNHEETVCQCFTDLCNGGNPRHVPASLAAISLIVPLIFSLYFHC